MSCNDIEAAIVAAGANVAPRITMADIEANIEIAYYFTGEEALQFAGSNGSPFAAHRSMKMLTFCVLVLKNGFTVTGESACASPANFSYEIGRKVARDNAISKIWPLLGYELRTKLAVQAERLAQAAKLVREVRVTQEAGGPELTRCQADCDGECRHPQCPQLRDGEPSATGRHCPIDTPDERS